MGIRSYSPSRTCRKRIRTQHGRSSRQSHGIFRTPPPPPPLANLFTGPCSFLLNRMALPRPMSGIRVDHQVGVVHGLSEALR